MKSEPPKEHVNIGIKPLGRGAEPSAVIVKEIAAIKKFVAVQEKIFPVNNMGAAKQYRINHLEFLEDMGQAGIAAKVRSIYKSLNLDY
jgi:hypothetical protein